MQDIDEREEEEEDGDLIFTKVPNILDGEEDYYFPQQHRCGSHTLNLVATKDTEEAAKVSEPFKKISRSTLGKC